MIMDLMDLKRLHADTTAQCRKYVDAFCEIMGYEPYYAEWIGCKHPDIFGIVTIGDEFWSMTDICYVIGQYEHWLELYGTKEKVEDVIWDWYWYHISESIHYAPLKEGELPINLEHWLMGARPTEKETSEAYKQFRAEELAKARQRVEDAKAALMRAVDNENNKRKTL